MTPFQYALLSDLSHLWPTPIWWGRHITHGQVVIEIELWGSQTWPVMVINPRWLQAQCWQSTKSDSFLVQSLPHRGFSSYLSFFPFLFACTCNCKSHSILYANFLWIGLHGSRILAMSALVALLQKWQHWPNNSPPPPCRCCRGHCSDFCCLRRHSILLAPIFPFPWPYVVHFSWRGFFFAFPRQRWGMNNIGCCVGTWCLVGCWHGFSCFWKSVY